MCGTCKPLRCARFCGDRPPCLRAWGAFSVLGFSASGPQCPPGTGHQPLSWCVSASWRTYFCSFRSCALWCLSLFSTKRSFVPVSDNLFPCAPWVPGFLVEVLNTVHVYVEFVCTSPCCAQLVPYESSMLVQVLLLSCLASAGAGRPCGHPYALPGLRPLCRRLSDQVV